MRTEFCVLHIFVYRVDVLKLKEMSFRQKILLTTLKEQYNYFSDKIKLSDVENYEASRM